ncbi:ribonuclease domain-containing protein [Mycobacterium sp. 3519A]|uniref:ribonuclease domain-containing protein n=1 Tax=Mycobacterium sp. 3519A TaxID=2057184 RepID=UPI001F2B6D3B|nr:ribonuclease domain-containing protein [Mycobacterium sp. 3519A]
MSRRRIAIIALLVLAVAVGGWALLRTNSADPQPTSTGGVPTCPIATLPREAAETVRAIHSGGPFPFPRNDGVVFGNREGHLPDRAKGYYHEYTVISPGADNRSTKRIVTGGLPLTSPSQYFYTGDHYDSFCLITDAGGR